MSRSNPATLKRRRTVFCPSVANYASRRTALFIATFGSCDVMPCYLCDCSMGMLLLANGRFVIALLIGNLDSAAIKIKNTHGNHLELKMNIDISLN